MFRPGSVNRSHFKKRQFVRVAHTVRWIFLLSWKLIFRRLYKSLQSINSSRCFNKSFCSDCEPHRNTYPCILRNDVQALLLGQLSSISQVCSRNMQLGTNIVCVRVRVCTCVSTLLLADFTQTSNGRRKRESAAVAKVVNSNIALLATHRLHTIRLIWYRDWGRKRDGRERKTRKTRRRARGERERGDQLICMRPMIKSIPNRPHIQTSTTTKQQTHYISLWANMLAKHTTHTHSQNI